MTLSEPQKKYLRGLGHHLKPLIMIGDAGLSKAVAAEYESTLAHHELIKVRIRTTDRRARDEMIRKLCDEHSATLVQRIGNIALVYRENPDKAPESRLRLPSTRR